MSINNNSDTASFFDNNAQNYKDIVSKNMGIVNGGSDYLCEYKIKLTRQFTGKVDSVLDFGAGIGLLQNHIHKYFHDASQYYASDISLKSLESLGMRFPDVIKLESEKVFKNKYSLIIVSCVLHHVERKERKHLLSRLINCLKPGGTLAIFEHNPRNPFTQLVVKTCPIDKGVTLISRSQLIRWFHELEYSPRITSGYSVFFPDFLKFARRLESIPRFNLLPLGAQYFTFFVKAA